MRNILILLLMAVSVSFVYAQSQLDEQNQIAIRNFDFGANFYLGIPQKEFKENLGRNGYGINFEALWSPPKQFFSVGLNVGFLNYGTRTRKERFSYTIPDVTVDVTNSNNLLNYHITFLVKPNTYLVQPYIQGFFGGSYIYTETKIQNSSTQEEIASSKNFEDYAWSYGVAAGLMIDIYKSTPNPDNPYQQQTDVKLNLKVSYLNGTDAQYLKEGSIRYVGAGKVEYDVLKSRTDLLGIHIGLIFNFR
jgi:hypothetical protein